MSSLRSISFGFAVALCAASGYLLYPASADSTVPRLAKGWDIPPVAKDIYLTAQPESKDGNALLDVRYVPDQGLGETVTVRVGDGEATLYRDPKDRDRYTGLIHFDFPSFVEEQAQRQKLADTEPSAAVFDGREYVGKVPLTFLEPNRLQEMINDQFPIHIPYWLSFGPPGPTDAARSLMITHPSVVDDPTRTFDACTGVGNPNGAWTFNKLVTDMANQQASGVDPADLVESWLQQWSTVTAVNSFPVGGGGSAISQVLAQWPRVPATGKLDLTKSQMRLLAIVNRIDLRHPARSSTYGGGGAESPASGGEGRFVFAALKRDANGCEAIDFTVNLEYELPFAQCTAVRDYALQWNALGSLVQGSPTYNARLQSITRRFTRANAAPDKPTGSAIAQVRTNDETVPSKRELREFSYNGVLDPAPVKQTPDLSFNHSATLASFIHTNRVAIMTGAYVVPLSLNGQPFRAGSAINDGQPWSYSPLLQNDKQARHVLSLNTCSGCHRGETATAGFHVQPRAAGAQAGLSDFMTGAPVGGTLDDPMLYDISDPVDPNFARLFGELYRRRADMAMLINNGCSAGGVLVDIHNPQLAVYTH